MSETTGKIRPQLADEAASFIRDQITSGTLGPGSRVRPEVIAQELGISTTPAREALQGLRSEGFLELAPRRGFTVARVTGEDIRDIYLLQSIVAGELAARATLAMTDQGLNQLEELHRQLSAAAEAHDHLAVEELNHDFHRRINQTADSRKLSWVTQMLSRYAPRRFYASIPGWLATTMVDHERIMEALRARDPERAKSEMARHLLHAGEQLAEHVDARLAAASDRDAPQLSA